MWIVCHCWHTLYEDTSNFELLTRCLAASRGPAARWRWPRSLRPRRYLWIIEILFVGFWHYFHYLSIICKLFVVYCILFRGFLTAVSMAEDCSPLWRSQPWHICRYLRKSRSPISGQSFWDSHLSSNNGRRGESASGRQWTLQWTCEYFAGGERATRNETNLPLAGSCNVNLFGTSQATFAEEILSVQQETPGPVSCGQVVGDIFWQMGFNSTDKQEKVVTWILAFLRLFESFDFFSGPSWKVYPGKRLGKKARSHCRWNRRTWRGLSQFAMPCATAGWSTWALHHDIHQDPRGSHLIWAWSRLKWWLRMMMSNQSTGRAPSHTSGSQWRLLWDEDSQSWQKWMHVLFHMKCVYDFIYMKLVYYFIQWTYEIISYDFIYDCMYEMCL